MSASPQARARRLVEPLLRQPVHPAGRRALAAKRIGAALGFHVVPRHFYSPVPDLELVNGEVFDRVSPMAGVEADAARQIEFLETALAPYVAEFAERGPEGYDLTNGGYESVESEVLYAMIRHYRPRRVLEVGTGYSTQVTAAAARENKADGSPLQFVSIDPNPTQNTGRLPEGSLDVDQRPVRVQDVPLGEFERLEAGDILFVDGTHTVVIDGDVNFVVLDVLPHLRPGVLVHFHDIYLPYEYPRYFIERFSWNEQYLLQAFLACNPSYEVLFGAHHVAREFGDRVARVVASFDPRRPPTAYWLRRR